MQKLILCNFLSPGDVLMLTAAVRDLHRCYPGCFATDVRTSCPALWENNPWLTPLDAGAPGVRSLACHYPLIHESDRRPGHFVEGFTEYLNEQLGLHIHTTAFRADLHLSAEEKSGPSPIRERVGLDVPYWIIVAGGKYDFTIKWWQVRRWQAVVDAFRGRILFVQVGDLEHYHPALEGVIDLRGRTSLRGLVRLMYRASGVVCPVTFVMHLAAAVECPPSSARGRAGVVIAGGRESPHWESYPTHQFIHTVGALPCCAEGGCWRSRVVPLGDDDDKDRAEHLCLDVVGGLPACMRMITPEMVCERIALYAGGGRGPSLTRRQARVVAPHLARRGFRGMD